MGVYKWYSSRKKEAHFVLVYFLHCTLVNVKLTLSRFCLFEPSSENYCPNMRHSAVLDVPVALLWPGSTLPLAHAILDYFLYNPFRLGKSWATLPQDKRTGRVTLSLAMCSAISRTFYLLKKIISKVCVSHPKGHISHLFVSRGKLSSYLL